VRNMCHDAARVSCFRMRGCTALTLLACLALFIIISSRTRNDAIASTSH